MADNWELATYEALGAAYFNGKLVIWAHGKKPGGGYEVRIRHDSAFIWPPPRDYFLEQKSGTGTDVITDYKISRQFGGPYVETIYVHHANGVQTIPVWLIHQTIPDPAGLLSAQGIAALAAEPTGGGASPSVAGKAEDLQKETAMPKPLKDFKVRSAKGYSYKFDVGEAIQDALRNLSLEPDLPPDWLSSYTVQEIGVEIGGIAGVRQVFVRIETFDITD